MAAAKGAAPPKAKVPKIRVSYVLGGGAHETRHCFGVSALAATAAKPQVLYSGGRDSLIFGWDVGGPSAQHIRSFTEHTDWVNDLFLADEGRILVSASSDTTIKVWNTDTAAVVKSIVKHSDYVKALAYAPKINCFASAGLDKMIYLWDLETGAASASADAVSGRPVEGHKDSIYCLAVNRAGSRLVSGSTENIIRVWDPRDGKKTMKLKGHTDIVKSVLVNEEGTLVLSGSSDGSIRLWDLGQQRCVHTYDPHTDSVWALAADDAFARVYSGGRDKRVFVTELATSESSLLFEEAEPVVRLLLTGAADGAAATLWSTSTTPAVHAWPLDAANHKRKAKFAQAAPERLQLESSSPSALASAKIAAQVALEGTALVSAPRLAIAGRAGIVKHVTLNNRRHVLTADAAGRVAKWDVMRGTLVADLGDKLTIDEHAKNMHEMLAIANWFSVDTRTGAVTINLDCPQCFTGECYAEDFPDYPNSVSSDQKVNLGERVLVALFENWAKGVRARMQPRMPVSPPSSPDPGAADPERSAAKREKKEKKEKEKKARHDEDEASQPLPPTFLLPDHTPVIVSDEASGSVLLRTTVAQLTGKEPSLSIPTWVQDAVLNGVLPLREQPKLSFALLPFDKDMKKGDWKDSKLTGSRLMRVKKVSAHVVSRLNLKLPVHSATDSGAARDWQPHEMVEIVCAGAALDPRLTLAAARQYVWKSSDDLTLYYRFTEAYKRHAKPAS